MCMCVKAQTHSNKDNYVPLYKFNWKETKSLQVPFRFLRLEVMWNSSRTLNKFHSVIYGKYGASHQSTLGVYNKACEADHKIKKKMSSPPKKSVHFCDGCPNFLWHFSNLPILSSSLHNVVFFSLSKIISLFFILKNLPFYSVFPSGARVGWTCRCVLSMTAAVTKTAMLRTAGQRPAWTHHSHLWYETLCYFVFSWRVPVCFSLVSPAFVTWDPSAYSTLNRLLSRVSRALPYRTETRRRRTRTRWMTVAGSGGCRGGCRRKPVWRWLWLGLWPACRWRWRGRSRCTDARLLLIWLVSHKKLKNFYLHMKLFLSSSI